MRKVLITGGNKGIGLETAKLFLKSKRFEVFVTGRDFSQFELRDQRLKTIVFDLNQLKKIPQLVKKIGAIDILINNAGIMNALPFDQYPVAKKQKLMNVNLEAPLELIKHFSPAMIKKRKGRIVNVASIAGQIGHPDVWYGISKAALINATKSFAKILGPKGIVSAAVAPGPVKTAMLNTIPLPRRRQIKAQTINNRFASAQEVAQIIYWLGTDLPDYVNGICVDINNGAFMR
ncbi:MAG: SDR family NAD(P)-dependent oxidoreductase [Candidatus Moranbacteria bacterium]|nr:SDR family NAD(P)-dependent oxidoreductase [Candidatus Moranbacteria bacterium]